MRPRHKERGRPPTINLEPRRGLRKLNYVGGISRKPRPQAAISNSMGFGGHNVVVAFSKV